MLQTKQVGVHTALEPHNCAATSDQSYITTKLRYMKEDTPANTITYLPSRHNSIYFYDGALWPIRIVVRTPLKYGFRIGVLTCTLYTVVAYFYIFSEFPRQKRRRQSAFTTFLPVPHTCRRLGMLFSALTRKCSSSANKRKGDH